MTTPEGHRHDGGAPSHPVPTHRPAGPGDAPRSWMPEPLPEATAPHGERADPGGMPSDVPAADAFPAPWAVRAQPFSADDSLAQAFARVEQQAVSARRARSPRRWQETEPFTVEVASREPSQAVAWLVLTGVVLLVIVGGDRWGGGSARIEPTGTVTMGDWSALAPVESLDLPVAGYEEQPERLRPAVDPTGLAGSHEFLLMADGAPVGWSPCRPLHVVVNMAHAPEGFIDWVAHVLAEAGDLTGLEIVLDGETSEPASFGRRAYQPERYGGRWAPAIIGFADESSVPRLAGPVGGLGGASDVAFGGSQGYVTGVVVLDTTLLDLPRYDGEPGYVQVLRHEVGHLLGLAHVDDVRALMHPNSSRVTTWGPGDRAGLAALGAIPCQPDL